MSDEVLVQMPDNKYVALLNYDDTLAPLVASSLLTKDFIFIDGIIRNLLQETMIKPVLDDNGFKIGERTQFHPDLFKFMKMRLEYEKQISSLNMQAGVKDADMSLDLLKIVLNDKEMLTPEQRREIGKQLMKRRFNHGDS